ncbi:MAG: hypothetical protein ACHQEB_07165 [Chitinophagales bacterium]
MRFKVIAIILFILVSLFPVYLLDKYLKKIVKPRQSAGRLLLYMFVEFTLIFAYTFFLVLAIKNLIPRA